MDFKDIGLGGWSWWLFSCSDETGLLLAHVLAIDHCAISV